MILQQCIVYSLFTDISEAHTVTHTHTCDYATPGHVHKQRRVCLEVRCFHFAAVHVLSDDTRDCLMKVVFFFIFYSYTLFIFFYYCSSDL